MKKVTILRGCSGSGKSTYAKSLNPSVVCSADHYFTNSAGEYNFDPSKLSDAHSDCLRKFCASLEAPEAEVSHIVVDNTNTTAVEIAPYAALAIAHGCELQIVTLLTKPEIAAPRNVHSVPENAVKAQYQRLISERLPPWWPQTVVGE